MTLQEPMCLGGRNCINVKAIIGRRNSAGEWTEFMKIVRLGIVPDDSMECGTSAETTKIGKSPSHGISNSECSAHPTPQATAIKMPTTSLERGQMVGNAKPCSQNVLAFNCVRIPTKNIAG